MRVIAGRFKGLALATPKSGTRPTTDRTKEAIFSRLDSWGVINDARVLDLFAGTGALGIEALSRGARELVAVESSHPAAALIAGTFSDLRRHSAFSADMRTQVVTRRAEQFVATPAAAPFDLVFIDPPYAFTTEECNQLLAALVEHGYAGESSTIVFERSTRSEAPEPPAGWQITERRDYGETAVYYLES